MAFNYIEEIPPVSDLLKELPLSSDLLDQKKKRDEEIADAFKGVSNKFILIIGPCSADNEQAVLEYVHRLKKVNDKVQDKLILIPRIYTNKPRTTGQGYKGMAHQPDPLEEPDIVKGLKAIRHLHLTVLKETGLSSADEMLYPSNYPYLEDLLSYCAIGARSVENQQHRLTVSGLDIPAGMKNPTGGDLNIMINSIVASQVPHTFIYHDWVVKTTGNSLAHAILRGAYDHNGNNLPNYRYEDIMQVIELYEKKKLFNPAIVIDTSHANSNKQFKEQPRIAHEVLEMMNRSEQIRNHVKGFMIESYLVEGSQSTDGKTYGQSITDPCLGWEDSEKLIYEIADAL